MRTLLLVLALALAGCQRPPAPLALRPDLAATDAGVAASPRPPVAPKRPETTGLHGLQRVDPYAWMKTKGTPELESYLKAENAYTDAVMAPHKPLRDALLAEMKGRTKAEDSTPPYAMRGYTYVSKIGKGQQYWVELRRKLPDGPEEVLVDLNALGKNEKFIGLSELQVSDDNALLLYSTDVTGFRDYTLYAKTIASGALFPEQFSHVTSAAWAADNKTFFYTTENDAKRSYRLYRHALGDNPSKDPLLYEEKDEHFDLGVHRTRSRAFVVLSIGSLTTSEERVLEATRPTGPFKVVLPRVPDRQYELSHRGSSFLLRINDTGRTFRLVEVPVANPQRGHWKELIASRPDVQLERVEVFKDFTVVEERSGGLPRLRAVDFARGTSTEFQLPEQDSFVTGAENPEMDARTFRFTFMSMVTPPSVLERTMATGETKLVWRDEVPTYDSSRYETRRVEAVTGDGTKVPISLAFRKGTRQDGSAPMVLKGYGAYGIPLDAVFSQTDVSFMDRGVILAMAHIRGGGELGKSWHDAGRMMNKRNTFTDFIACAEALVAQRWTASDRLAINGVSAGGLLMGAVLNMRPELFKAALVEVPFVDVVNTMLDESLPLTVPEFEEWGNPREKAAYDYLMSYSPYDNVAARAYPAMLVRSSYNDSQVLFHEPTKYVAKLRALKTDANVLLLKMEMDPAGHGGRSGRYSGLEDEAFYDSFLLWQLGITR